MRTTLTASAPPTPPVTTAEAKAWLDVEHAEDDAMIDSILQALAERVEAETGLALSSRTWTYTASTNEPIAIMSLQLPRAPVSSVEAVTHIDSEGTETLLTTQEDYYFLGTRVRLASRLGMPGGALLRTQFTAGYTAAEHVPAPIKLAMKRACKMHYDVPLDQVLGLMVSELPQPALDMLLPYRNMTV